MIYIIYNNNNKQQKNSNKKFSINYKIVFKNII